MATGLILLIPALDEAEHLPGVLRAVGEAGLAEAGLEVEVVVIDDGSRDATAVRAAELGARVVRHPFRLGYGAAVQTGYKLALERGAGLVVQMDADGQHDPREIPGLVEPILRGEADLVVGSRFLPGGDYAMGPLRSLGRRLFEALGRLAGVAVSDPTSGFQALNRAALGLYVRDFFPHDYPDVDVLVAAARAGLRVRERPVRMRASPRPSTLHGGTRAFYYAYKMLLSLWAASHDGERR